MPANHQESNRSPLDFVHFGIISMGFLLVAAGVISASAPVALTGLIAMGWGLAYFFFKERF
jgi:hypothetical protein